MKHHTVVLSLHQTLNIAVSSQGCMVIIEMFHCILYRLYIGEAVHPMTSPGL